MAKSAWFMEQMRTGEPLSGHISVVLKRIPVLIEYINESEVARSEVRSHSWRVAESIRWHIRRDAVMRSIAEFQRLNGALYGFTSVSQNEINGLVKDSAINLIQLNHMMRSTMEEKQEFISNLILSDPVPTDQQTAKNLLTKGHKQHTLSEESHAPGLIQSLFELSLSGLGLISAVLKAKMS